MDIIPAETTPATKATPASPKGSSDLKAARDKEIKVLVEAQDAALADAKAKSDLKIAQNRAAVEAKVMVRVQKVKDQAAADVAAAEAAAAAELATTEVTAPNVDETYWYCLEESHPGAPNLQSSPLSLVRIFKSDKLVPHCPGCGRQVNAMPTSGPDIPPEYILDLQDRFGR